VALSPLSQEIEVAELPGGRDFRYFMANCLTLLEDVQLGVASPGGWTYVAGCSLPPVGSILNALSRERPDLIAEIVAVNTVHAEVMQMLRLHKRLGSSSPPEKIGQPVGEAMLEHLLLHTGTTRIRTDLLRSALRRALEDMAPGALRIVEIGSVSKAFSLELASICEEARAEYVVVEPDEAAFSELSAGLQTNAWARVMTPQHIAALDGADIVVSASMQFLGIVRDHQDVARLLDQGLRDRGRLLLATPAPTILADFVYGVNEGWFERSQNIEFPVGSIAGTSEFDDLVQRLRLQDARIQTCETTGGQVLLVEGRAPPVAQKPVAPRPHAKTIAIVSRDAVFPKVTPRSAIELVRLTGDTDEDRSLVAASAAIDDEDAAARYAYIPSTPAGTDGGSGWLAATCFELGWIADALQAKAGNAKPALAVLLPGGAPDGATASAAASGVWTYLRVLRNEFPGIDIHAVDVGSADGAVSFDTVEGVLRAVDQGGTNTEWLLDPATRTVSELRAVPGPVASERRRTRRFKSATLRQGISSQIASLEWQETDPPEPRDNDVVIAVEATGLNFRDVMWAMGMLPEEALEDGFAGPTIGMECAGEVTAVGAAVTDIAVGDRVMAIAPAAFSTHVVVDRRGVAHLPEPLGATAGATLPVAFVTAYYALVELARIVPSETVLIHGGAGGVGLAALQVAKSRGATVIATAGTVEKRRILETFGADHVLDSRSLSFVDDVLSLTDGEGVDVVLNSLFGEAMERGISLVKPFGRFLELGKRDFYADTKIGLRPFRRNISYFGIDADQLLGERPDLGSRILSEIAVHFGRGDFSALPYRLFGHDEIAGAFRLMQASGHVGKILVRPPVAGQDAVSVRETPPPQLDADGVQIVIGGVGGFGLAAARWLVERGARRIALVTRRGVADFATNAALREWKALGVVASVHACDATEEAAVETLLAELRAQAPIKGVVHAAMVLDDALVENLTPERFRTVIDAKAKSADLFDRLTREDPISTFLLFSSATTLVGNPGQGNYVAANGYLEGLARARRREGLPALAVGFGAISDVGVLKRQADVGEQLSKRIGKATLTAVQALAHVESYIARDPGTVEGAVVMIAEVDWATAAQLPIAATSLFEVIARSSRMQAGAADGDGIDLVAMLRGKSPQEGEDALFQLFAGEIAAVLRIAPSEITRLKVVKDIGLDSLMAMELGMSFKQKTGFDLPLGSVTQGTTVGDISRKLYLKVTQRGDQQAEPRIEETQVVDMLASRHASSANAETG
jgi:NADPH:quinone reductase-like Zn-dependent oxidoreductase/acyl carrier protein